MSDLVSTNTPTVANDEVHQCVNAWQALRAVYERVSSALADELASECGITLNEYEVLGHVGTIEPRQPRLGDLHAAVTLSQPALSRLVMRLELQGLLRRVDADEDRRTVLVGLTKPGRELLDKAAPIHAECIRLLLNDNMTGNEHAALINSFARIEANQD